MFNHPDQPITSPLDLNIGDCLPRMTVLLVISEDYSRFLEVEIVKPSPRDVELFFWQIEATQFVIDASDDFVHESLDRLLWGDVNFDALNGSDVGFDFHGCGFTRVDLG